MMFKHRYHDGIVAGDITRTYRRWKSPQVKTGNFYKLANRGFIEVTAVETGKVALRIKGTGMTDKDELLQLLGPESDDTLLYRIDFRWVAEKPASHIKATPVETDEIALALIKRDRDKPWTHPLLIAIHQQPGASSAVLADQLGFERPVLKQNVRKLKSLGLTISLEVGYKLTDKATSYLRATGHIA